MNNQKQIVIAILFVSSLVFAGVATSTTLKEAVEETLQTNPDVLIETNERLARDQALKQARAGYNPTVDFTLGVGHERSDNLTTRALGDGDAHMRREESALNFRQMLFDGFATRSEVRRQHARINSAAYTVFSTGESTAIQAVEAYLDVLRRQRLLELAQDNLLVHDKTFERVKRRSTSGVGRRADLDQVRGRRALAYSNVIAEENNLQDAKSTYLRVVGSLPVETALRKPEIQSSALPQTEAEAVEKALNNHPTLKSADADVDATKAQHEASKSTLYPRFDFEMQGSWNNDLDGQRGRNDDSQAMIRMRYNLLNGGRDLARQSETARFIDEAKEVRNRTHRQVVDSTRLAWAAYQSLTAQLEYRKQHVISSGLAREAYSKQFNLGRRTLLDLLDSENEHFEANRIYADTEYALLLAKYRILVAMGGLLSHLEIPLPEEARTLQGKDCRITWLGC